MGIIHNASMGMNMDVRFGLQLPEQGSLVYVTFLSGSDNCGKSSSIFALSAPTLDFSALTPYFFSNALISPTAIISYVHKANATKG